MKEPVWERCHYYCSGQCPEQSTIDKAYLIPQLLKPSQIKAATERAMRILSRGEEEVSSGNKVFQSCSQ
jgi:hypothetical protein